MAQGWTGLGAGRYRYPGFLWHADCSSACNTCGVCKFLGFWTGWVCWLRRNEIDSAELVCWCDSRRSQVNMLASSAMKIFFFSCSEGFPRINLEATGACTGTARRPSSHCEAWDAKVLPWRALRNLDSILCDSHRTWCHLITYLSINQDDEGSPNGDTALYSIGIRRCFDWIEGSYVIGSLCGLFLGFFRQRIHFSFSTSFFSPDSISKTTTLNHRRQRSCQLSIRSDHPDINLLKKGWTSSGPCMYCASHLMQQNTCCAVSFWSWYQPQTTSTNTL